MISGEGWPVGFIERMEEAWGARIHEGYGASQTYGGFVMSSCERGAVSDGQRNGMHFYEWAILLEVLDPETLEPVGPGEVGERDHASGEGGVTARPLPDAGSRALSAVDRVPLRPPARHG